MGVAKRIAGEAAIVEIGRRDERQGATSGAGTAILVLAESSRKHDQAQNTRPRNDNTIL